MITPQEVSQHAFSKASFGGYNMAQVDEFLDILTADYTTLYKENAVLKNKIKVLVDKVEEYRATEDAMRMTLLSAQKMANAMLQEAQEKKEAMLREAEAEVAKRIADLRKECENEAFRLAAAQNATAAYVAKLKELIEHEREFLDRLSELCPPAPPPADPVSTAASDIESSVSRLLSEEEPETLPSREDSPAEDPEDTKDINDLRDLTMQPSEEPAAVKAAPFSSDDPDSDEEDPDDILDELASTRRIDFDHLQFGRDYEIK